MAAPYASEVNPFLFPRTQDAGPLGFFQPQSASFSCPLYRAIAAFRGADRIDLCRRFYLYRDIVEMTIRGGHCRGSFDLIVDLCDPSDTHRRFVGWGFEVQILNPASLMGGVLGEGGCSGAGGVVGGTSSSPTVSLQSLPPMPLLSCRPVTVRSSNSCWSVSVQL